MRQLWPRLCTKCFTHSTAVSQNLKISCTDQLQSGQCAQTQRASVLLAGMLLRPEPDHAQSARHTAEISTSDGATKQQSGPGVCT